MVLLLQCIEITEGRGIYTCAHTRPTPRTNAHPAHHAQLSTSSSCPRRALTRSTRPASRTLPWSPPCYSRMHTRTHTRIRAHTHLHAMDPTWCTHTRSPPWAWLALTITPQAMTLHRLGSSSTSAPCPRHDASPPTAPHQHAPVAAHARRARNAIGTAGTATGQWTSRHDQHAPSSLPCLAPTSATRPLEQLDQSLGGS